MNPGKYDLKLYRGDTYSWRFSLWDDVGQTVPTDLTGAEVAAEIRDKPGGAIIVELAVTIAAPNHIDADLDADTSEMVPMSGQWDLQVTFPGDIVRTVLAGKVTTTADVTGSTVVGTTRRELRSA